MSKKEQIGGLSYKPERREREFKTLRGIVTEQSLTRKFLKYMRFLRL